MTVQQDISGQIVHDRYRLGRAVARTDAGVVFDGEDMTLRRHVAVEVASSIEDPRAQRKWLRDAMIAQQLVGEHVLRVLDVGEARGIAFVVRERSSRTLADELRERRLIPIPQAVGWTLDVCEAMAEAHAHGIAHGDVRLENIHLDGAGSEAKVKLAWTSAANTERAAHEAVARDVAGLGAMLRTLTTGQPTEDGDDLAPTLPDGLAHAVARSLAQEPNGGFHSIAELARTLGPYAPPGHPGPRNIARILSRAGIVSGAVAPAELPAARGRAVDRANFADEWFSTAPQPALGPPRHASRVGAVVSAALLAAVIGGTWFLWDGGMLPRWTGAAPPEPVGTTELTSASPSEEADHALDLANAAATDPSLAPVPGAVEPPAIAEREAAPARAPVVAPIEGVTPRAPLEIEPRAPAAEPAPTETPLPPEPNPSY